MMYQQQPSNRAVRQTRFGLLPEDEYDSIEVASPTQFYSGSQSQERSLPVVLESPNDLGSWEQISAAESSPNYLSPGSWEEVEVSPTLPVATEPVDPLADMHLDLNQLYINKCLGQDPPWRGSVLCNLGQGGALGQLVASLRLTRGRDGYNSNGIVVSVMLAFEGIQQLLTAQPGDPWYSRLVINIARRVPATQAFLGVYERLAAAVANNEHVEWSDFDALTEYAVSLMQVPVLRNALRVYMTDQLNVTLLDLGANQDVSRRGWTDRVMGWLFNKLGVIRQPAAEPEYFDAEDDEDFEPQSFAVDPDY